MRLNEDEWRREWDNILKLASSQPRTSGSSTPSASETEVDGRGESFSTSKTYESLEEIHVLALAHVLKRPIFVIADTVLKVGVKQIRILLYARVFSAEIPAVSCYVPESPSISGLAYFCIYFFLFNLFHS